MKILALILLVAIALGVAGMFFYIASDDRKTKIG